MLLPVWKRLPQSAASPRRSLERSLQLLDLPPDLGVFRQHAHDGRVLVEGGVPGVGGQKQLFLFPKVLLAGLLPEAQKFLCGLPQSRRAPRGRCFGGPTHQQRLSQGKVMMLAKRMQPRVAFHGCEGKQYTRGRVAAHWILASRTRAGDARMAHRRPFYRLLVLANPTSVSILRKSQFCCFKRMWSDLIRIRPSM